MSLWTERVVGLLQLIGLIAATTYVGYRWGRYTAALCGVVTAVIIIPPIGVTALAWVGGVALGPVGGGPGRPRPRRRRRPAPHAGGGRAAGRGRPAVPARPGAVPRAWRSGVLFLWALDGAGRRRLVLGLALGVSPYLVHLAVAGPGNVVRGMFIEPVFDLRPGRRLPFPPPHDEYTSFLNRAFAFRDFPWPLPDAEQPMQIACLVLGAGGVCARWWPSPCGPSARAASTAGGCWPSACSPPACCPRWCSGPTPPTCRG